MEVAKRWELNKCPSKQTDCIHYLVTGGLCNRRTYAGRKPDQGACTSYIRRV
jgi:hypothetical protein